MTNMTMKKKSYIRPEVACRDLINDCLLGKYSIEETDAKNTPGLPSDFESQGAQQSSASDYGLNAWDF